MALRYTAPYFLWVDGDGNPAAGWLLYFYETNSSTPLATYNDPDLDPSHANTNPVVANADGYWGPIWLEPEQYKVVLKDENDVQIWSADPVDGSLETDDSVAIQLQAGNYAVDSGAANNYVISLTPAPASLAAITGAPIRVRIANTNTDVSTLTINALSPANIFRPGTTTLYPGDLLANGIYTLVYNGTAFIVQEVAPLQTLYQRRLPSVVVPNTSVATTLANVGTVSNTGFAAFAIAFDGGGGNTWAGLVCAYQGATTITAGATSVQGTPGTPTFTMSGALLEMSRSAGPANVTVRITQIGSA